uniref:Uncharacterized protein n=1 Tax=Steinernema glaseri TaxID=37863 RepID=A0A1I7Z664_9BILA
MPTLNSGQNCSTLFPKRAQTRHGSHSTLYTTDPANDTLSVVAKTYSCRTTSIMSRDVVLVDCQRSLLSLPVLQIGHISDVSYLVGRPALPCHISSSGELKLDLFFLLRLLQYAFS